MIFSNKYKFYLCLMTYFLIVLLFIPMPSCVYANDVQYQYAHSLSAHDGQKKQNPRVFVQNFVKESLDILKKQNASILEKEALIGPVLAKYINIRAVAGFCLGQYRRLPSKEQKETYIKAFFSFMKRLYVVRLLPYANASFQLVGSVQKIASHQWLLKSRIFPQGKEAINVAWWLLEKNNKYKIFDIRVAGIWLTQEQRATFVSILQENNAQFSALLSALNKANSK